MERPPPIPQKPSNGSDSFAHHAARASWLAPLVAIGIGLFSQGAMSTQPEEYRFWGRLIAGGLACLIILAGFFLGIGALCGMKRHGRPGIFGPALIGAIINGLLIALALAAIPNFNKARERALANRKGFAQVAQVQKELNEAVSNQLQNGSNSQQAVEKANQFQKSLLNAAQNMSGDEALVMRAGSVYVQKLNSLKSNYDVALAALRTANVLRASTITDKAELAERRQLVQSFLDANTVFKDFLLHGTEHFRTECDRVHLSEKVTAAAVKGYQTKADLINPLMVKVREGDEQMGQSMLAIISLEETNWGQWKASSADGKIRFEDSNQAKAYNSYLAQIREVGLEQAKIQKQVLEASK